MAAICRFTVGFSGIRVRFCLPTAISLPRCFDALQIEDDGCPEEEYQVQLLTEPLIIPESPAHIQGDTSIYPTDKGWLHIHLPLGDKAGCQVACLFCPDGHHTLYYPASRWEEYTKNWSCAHLIQGERLLLRHDALLLHSSLPVLVYAP